MSDKTSIIPIASFEARERDAQGHLVFRRVPVKFVSEAAFTDSVVDLFSIAGWRVHHDRDKQNVQGHAGFYDIVAIRRGRIVLAELKLHETGVRSQPEVEQQKWLDAALQPVSDNMIPTPVMVVCWHPSDWDRIVWVATKSAL